ncbi:spermidine/putrescine ABC transporter substrate-binding protein [Marinomonas sp. M1K-6]|uniref:Spermidine/putrescine ABC transporter substrate-binding protein n=1 Tax=Marinomonas profundi TaxID=2726122 RepID=A0A847R963_9GAMM|nr:spermidine/putrescine ABC transporter substrate-binding protein [Marinomonas profundi]NLQ18596.1 spermidine/putrescine ABC transporter substrate-binding protein [Marinomonas profundi]UDV02910.1 spermidine/putrescine ABC transporter substrate-binding protein [Marinomonas profundi]
MKNKLFSVEERVLPCVLYILLPLMSCNVYSSATLNVLNWDDYLSADVIRDWEEKTGSKIRLITYDDEDIRDTLLTHTTEHQIDLAVVDARSVKKLASLGYLEHLNDSYRTGDVDSHWSEWCGGHAIPYLWGTFGIAYRVDKVAGPVLSWADFFSSRSDLVGHIGMTNDYTSLIAPALLTLQLPIDTNKAEHLKQAYELLKAQTRDVLTYEYAPSYLLTSKNSDELYAAAVYSGDQYTMDEALNKSVWRYVLPKDGSFVWLDCWVVPARAEKKSLAQSFLTFIGESRVAAMNSEEVGVATVDNIAYRLQSKAFRENELIYPTEMDLKDRLSFDLLSDFDIRQRIRIQEAIEVIHESK